MICCASHSAVGCRVTANHSSCCRPWPTTRNANKHSKLRGGNHAQINRSNRLGMVAQECPPALGWRTSASNHVLGYRRLGDLKAKLQEFAVYARGSPEWVSPGSSAGSAPAAPRRRQLLSKRGVLCLKPDRDLNGETRRTRTKPRRARVALTIGDSTVDQH